MRLSPFINIIANGQSSLMLQLLKTSNEFYRACFVSAAMSKGIYDNFIDGKASFEHLCEKLNASNREGLKAWLELGVCLGELKRAGSEYQVKGKLSRALLKPGNDAYKAILQEIVEYHYSYVMNTPTVIEQHKLFPFDETPGELIARSSRISEPFIFEAVDDAIPPRGSFLLLEVGCGSGTYIKRACTRNPELITVGLELQEKVANAARDNMKAWGLEHRATIEHADVRNYSSTQKFDLITLHQNIHYFSVQERESLFRHLSDFLKPGGQVLVTAGCQGGGPAMEALNIWVSNTEGYGPLPNPAQLCQQFKDAGFAKVKTKRLVPFESLWAFSATKAA